MAQRSIGMAGRRTRSSKLRQVSGQRRETDRSIETNDVNLQRRANEHEVVLGHASIFGGSSILEDALLREMISSQLSSSR